MGGRPSSITWMRQRTGRKLIVYRTTAKRDELPVTTYLSEDVNDGKVMYLPRFGEYSHTDNSLFQYGDNAAYYAANTSSPAIRFSSSSSGSSG